MIKEAYCSFEIAKLLKEKGFDGACNRVYQGPKLKYTTLDISPLMCLGGLGGFDPKQLYVTNSELGDIVYAAPTHQMALAWLRTKHIVIVIGPIYFSVDGTCFSWEVVIFKDGAYDKVMVDYHTYEDAVEAAIKYCLEKLF